MCKVGYDYLLGTTVCCTSCWSFVNSCCACNNVETEKVMIKRTIFFIFKIEFLIAKWENRERFKIY